MPDLQYKPTPFVFNSRGIIARFVEDNAPSPEAVLNAENCEELAEGAWSQRLGSIILNSDGVIGGNVYPLSAGVVSLFRLGGLGGNEWRYAVCSDGTLWRRSSLSPGAFNKISSSMSGNPVFASSYSTSYASTPYIVIADQNGVIKDNGSLSSPQRAGIFPPQFPATAQAQAPSLSVILDGYLGSASDYSYSGVSGGSIGSFVSTSLSSGVSSTGIQSVTVADPKQPSLFQYLTVDTGDNEENVLVLRVTSTGFTANFQKTHASGVPVSCNSISVSVPASTTATISKSFPGGIIPPSETVSDNQSDYIGLALYVGDPQQVQSITLKFDCGDGSFQSDYFYKVIAQGPLQNLIETATSSSSTDVETALTDAVLSESMNLYGNSAGSIAVLNTGDNVWTSLLVQLSDFAGSGRASYSDPAYNWSNVNGYQLTIVMNDTSSTTIQMSSLVLFGNSGPDTLGGVAYDYLWTFFDEVDGTESNPCVMMSDQNPPNETMRVYPRRQPVLVSFNTTTYGPLGQDQDAQITHARVYRRGGTLGDAFRLLDKVPITISTGGVFQYLDTTSDADLASSDILSFTNDVPVTSSLPYPVNTTLVSAITTPGQVVTITPESMQNISVRQVVTIGSPTAIENNFELATVLSVSSSSFTAYVQNAHSASESVQATASVGQPVSMIAQAYGAYWYAGDTNNPNYLYRSAAQNPQYVGAASYIAVSTPDDTITGIININGGLYVSTEKSGWWTVSAGQGGTTVYPTRSKYGSVSTQGVTVTEKAGFYQAVDGIRAFNGGESEYLTQNQEFIFQGIGKTPIPQVDPSKISKTTASFWNSMVFFAYIALDGIRRRLIYHQKYGRWRNDDVDAQSMSIETDTSTLLYGDTSGLIHVDRQDLGYDQVNQGGVVEQGPISINLQTPYLNQGAPANQKNYQNLQIDCDTQGQPLTLTLWFDDGSYSIVVGQATPNGRQKVNFPINQGDGQSAYKISLQLTGEFTKRIYIYQASIEHLVLPMTRKSFDTYDLNLGGSDSKFARDAFFQYSASQPITVNVYYDSSATPGYTFTLPAAGGIRNPMRFRLPAVSFRTIRFIGNSAGDFRLWSDCCLWYKFQCQGRGYSKAEFIES